MTRIFLLLAGVLFVGCAIPTVSVPIKSNLNDFVANGTKTNSKDTVSYSFASELRDTIIQPYGKNKAPADEHAPGFMMAERSSFESMSKKYIESKFSNISPNANVKISISLEDFYIEQSTTSSSAQIAAVAFVGGEIPYLLSAYVKAKVTVDRNGQIQSKTISASSDESFVQGIGTGTATSNIYKGENSSEFKFGKAVDDANNKAIMFIGKYLEEQGL